MVTRKNQSLNQYYDVNVRIKFQYNVYFTSYHMFQTPEVTIFIHIYIPWTFKLNWIWGSVLNKCSSFHTLTQFQPEVLAYSFLLVQNHFYKFCCLGLLVQYVPPVNVSKFKMNTYRWHFMNFIFLVNIREIIYHYRIISTSLSPLGNCFCYVRTKSSQ